MFLIVGLGNPGEKYINTRHNVGFLVIDELKKKLNFSDFIFDKKSNSLLSKKEDIILAKPNTYMNLSGLTARALSKYYKMENENQIIVHDDIDLLLGKIRISKGQGSAGHKGVESIIKDLGTKSFVRIRIGIQPKTGKPKKTEEFVLKKFNKGEEKIVAEAVKRAAEAIKTIMKDGLEKAMNEFNN
jgi:PTH1 family peptidyl-tRNA hydrolase